MPYVAAGLAFGLFYLFKQRLPRAASRMPYVQFLWYLALAAGTIILATTQVGDWVSGVVAGAAGWIGGLVGVDGAILVTAVFVLLAGAAVFDLVDGKVEGIAKTGIIVLPFLALVSAGPVAGAASELFAVVSSGATDPLLALVGQ